MHSIGYDKPLFVQPFDHRGSFTKGFFGLPHGVHIDSGTDQFSPVARAKTIVYQGLLKAIEMGVSKEHVGILVDTQFGSHILDDARDKEIPVSVCVEKSGQSVFDFEYGGRWVDHLRFIQPDIVKVLVRYHPHGDRAENVEQMARLKLLSEYIHSTQDHYYMFELLVPATTAEDREAGADYDTQIRPGLMVQAIRELQEFGIEPDIWKIEGLDRREDAEAVSEQARAGKSSWGESRAAVGSIILGRGSNKEKVYEWLRVGAPVAGFIGFAVGRTNFSEPLKRFIADPSQEEAAIEEIARNYKGCVDTWQQAASG